MPKSLAKENAELKATLKEVTVRMNRVVEELKEMEVGVIIQGFRLIRDRGKSGRLWIVRKNGEEMACSGETESALESLLEQFWEENF